MRYMMMMGVTKANSKLFCGMDAYYTKNKKHKLVYSVKIILSLVTLPFFTEWSNFFIFWENFVRPLQFQKGTI